MSTRKLALLVLFVVGVASCAFLVGGRDAPPVRVESADDPPRHYGWINDPDAVRECAESMGCLPFRETPAFAAASGDSDDVYLWEAARQATGDLLPARDQKSVGACVAFATASAIEYLMYTQIANESAESYRDLVQEVIYGGSRFEVGGGRVRGDGSVGAWAAKWVRDYGVVARGVHGKHDLRVYSEALCREYGRRGVPDDLEPLAREHPVRGVANVRSWDECRAAIRNGYPVVVCSDQGFTFTRDADGFATPRGKWYHAMAVIGVRGGEGAEHAKLSGRARPGGFLLNSWGDRVHTGPSGPGDPPACGFWVDAHVLDRMLRQGDSWAFSRFAGFPVAVSSRQRAVGSGNAKPRTFARGLFN